MGYQDFPPFKKIKTTSGGVIKAFRKNFEITQHELSRVTGIAESNLSAIENDRVDIGLKRAVLIAAALGIDPVLLLFPNGYREAYSKEVKAVERAAAKMRASKKAV